MYIHILESKTKKILKSIWLTRIQKKITPGTQDWMNDQGKEKGENWSGKWAKNEAYIQKTKEKKIESPIFPLSADENLQLLRPILNMDATIDAGIGKSLTVRISIPGIYFFSRKSLRQSKVAVNCKV